jgi:hypothetical protein
MADNQSPPKADALPQGAKYEAPKLPPKQNPAFRMMGSFVPMPIVADTMAHNLQVCHGLDSPHGIG